MNDERLKEFVEASFLKPLLFKKGVTDISYNGEELFYETNLEGRKKARLEVDRKTVGDFLRQIANYGEKQFSFSEPFLDLSFSRYRLNAAFTNIVRVKDGRSYSFSLRILGEQSVIKDNSPFFEGEAREILVNAINNGESIVIGGITSSGKTELQKYLLLHLKEATRVIVVDNLQELERIRGASGIDLTSWQVDERYNASTYSSLIRNALRNCPDLIVVAEARGAEMNEAITSVSSGHPVLMTIHSKDLVSMPERMVRLALLGGQRILREELLEEVYHHFTIFVYLAKKIKEDGTIFRYVQSIGRLNEKEMKMDIIYERKDV